MLPYLPKWCTLIYRNGAFLFTEVVHSYLPILVHCYLPITTKLLFQKICTTVNYLLLAYCSETNTAGEAWLHESREPPGLGSSALTAISFNEARYRMRSFLVNVTILPVFS